MQGSSFRRQLWSPPSIKKLSIRSESGAAPDQASTSSEPQSASPAPPAAPDSKLGFAFEWAFPLAARVTE
jgi:hypothetical protein